MLLRLTAAMACLAAASPVLADGPTGGPALSFDGGWRISAGYSRPLAKQTGLVGDVIREQRRALGETVSIAELGVRRELGRETALSFGIGAGTGSPSAPRWRVIAGFEQNF